jgi:hypothetical protein
MRVCGGRDQLERPIRAAGDLLGEDTIIVMGSQAILATVSTADDEVLTRSMEADLLPTTTPMRERQIRSMASSEPVPSLAHL